MLSHVLRTALKSELNHVKQRLYSHNFTKMKFSYNTYCTFFHVSRILNEDFECHMKDIYVVTLLIKPGKLA